MYNVLSYLIPFQAYCHCLHSCIFLRSVVWPISFFFHHLSTKTGLCKFVYTYVWQFVVPETFSVSFIDISLCSMWLLRQCYHLSGATLFGTGFSCYIAYSTQKVEEICPVSQAYCLKYACCVFVHTYYSIAWPYA